MAATNRSISLRRMARACVALAFAAGFVMPAQALAAPRGAPTTFKTRGFTAYKGRRSVRGREFKIASYNVQNLFKYRPNEADQRIQKRGARRGRSAHYVPKSEAEYRGKVDALAKQIAKNLGTPDVIALQEVENFRQFKGNKSALHDLVKAIERHTEAAGKKVTYQFTNSPGFSDIRGIANAFLYRTDRVRLANVTASHPILGERSGDGSYKRRDGTEVKFNQGVWNPKSLNTQATEAVMTDRKGRFVFPRPVLVGAFEIFKDRVGVGKAEVVHILNNHLKSNPSEYKSRRRAQAGFNAKLVKDLTKANPNAKVIVAGDMNVDLNQRDHRGQLGAIEGLTPSKRGPNLLENLTSRLDHKQTYVWKGKEQHLDWVYASPNLASSLIELRTPHINSPQPKDARASDHDPVIARFLGWND